LLLFLLDKTRKWRKKGRERELRKKKKKRGEGRGEGGAKSYFFSIGEGKKK